MRAGLEGAGTGPFCGLKRQQWLPSGTWPAFCCWTFFETGFCSTKVSDLIVQLGGLEALRRRGFCSPSNPESWAEGQWAGRNEQGWLFHHHRNTSLYLGTLETWHEKQGKASVVADSTPQEQKVCLPHERCIMKSEQTPEEHIYLQDNKIDSLRLHKYIQSHTYTSFRFNELQNSNTKERCYQIGQGLTPT